MNGKMQRRAGGGTEQATEKPSQGLARLVTSLVDPMVRISCGRVSRDLVASWALSARIAAEKNPLIMKCTNESLALSFLDAARCGLAFDGVQGALVPRWSSKVGGFECHFEPMFRGLIHTLVDSGAVVDVDAVAVYHGETFAVSRGTDRTIVHEQRYDVPRNDESLVAVYVVFTMPGGIQKFEVMSREQVEKRRDENGSKKKDGTVVGPWVTWFTEMAIKTVVRRGEKMIPHVPPHAREVLEIEGRAAAGLPHLSRSLMAEDVGAIADSARTAPQTEKADAAPEERNVEALEATAEKVKKPPKKAPEKKPRWTEPEAKRAGLLIRSMDDAETQDELDRYVGVGDTEKLPGALMEVLRAHSKRRAEALAGETGDWSDEARSLLDDADALRDVK